MEPWTCGYELELGTTKGQRPVNPEIVRFLHGHAVGVIHQTHTRDAMKLSGVLLSLALRKKSAQTHAKQRSLIQKNPNRVVPLA